MTDAPRCDHQSGDLVDDAASPLISFLEDLQSAAADTFGDSGGFDPKLYVDLPLSRGLAAAADAFSKLRRSPDSGVIPPEVLKGFLTEYTGKAGSDLLAHDPPDFVQEPEGFLLGVESAEVMAWALEVHSLWKSLSRRVSGDVAEHPEEHTLLPLPEPVVVPGSRFREVYYWDSFWTIRGLLASKMYNTAKAIVQNHVFLFHAYGFVPNGARSYYINRSQPPLLSSMVREIYEATDDLEFVNACFPVLLKEYNFWNSGNHKVVIQDKDGHRHFLCRYYAFWNKPRPESGTIDRETASKLSNSSQKEHLYHQLASAAESGWDFSSRWLSDSSDLTTMVTTSIIPVDLNAYIHKMELDISFFAKRIGDEALSEEFLKMSEKRQSAMRSILWSDDMGQWLDYWLKEKCNTEGVYHWQAQNQNHNAFASNFIPLWVETFRQDLHGKEAIAEKVASSLRKSGLIRSAGIATSLINSGQQWDFPNGWPPLQHMIVEGLAKSRSRDAFSLAQDIARRWLSTNYAVYKKTGAMMEKYDVEAHGAVGGGGEYQVQAGFGWSIGVVLAFLEEFGWPCDMEIDC